MHQMMEVPTQHDAHAAREVFRHQLAATQRTDLGRPPAAPAPEFVRAARREQVLAAALLGGEAFLESIID
jgi:hypothetical protein